MVIKDLVADPDHIAPSIRRLLSGGRGDAVRHMTRLVSDLAGREERVGVEDCTSMFSASKGMNLGLIAGKIRSSDRSAAARPVESESADHAAVSAALA